MNLKRYLSLVVAVFMLFFTSSTANAKTYNYDYLGRLISVTYDNGQKIDYKYDAGGNLLKVIVPDLKPPTVIKTDPANDSTGVPTNKAVVVTFSENIAAGSNFNGIILKAGSSTVSSNINIQGSTLTIAPASNLQNETVYNVTIPARAVKDAAGNELTAAYSFNFTTNASVDLIPPSVTATDPANGAANVTVDKTISVTFSESILAGANMKNLTLTKGQTVVGYTYSLAGNQLIIDPVSNLGYNTNYTVNIPAVAVQDTAGNELNNGYTFSFTTNSSLDINPPVISSTYPTNNALNVPVDKLIQIRFSETIQAGSNINNLTLKTGETVVDFKYSIIGNTLTIDPTENFNYGTNYTLMIPAGAVNDLEGNSQAVDYSLSFTTSAAPDTTSPTVISTDPAINSTGVAVSKAITITFSENVLAGSDVSNITLKNGSTAINYSYLFFDNILTITPVNNLSYNTNYTVTIPAGAAKDLSGNGMISGHIFSFTTEIFVDNQVPAVNITSPANGSYAGLSGSNVTITATATDNVSVTKVEFYVDNIKIGESVTAPYSYSWACTQGNHTLLAKAYDAAGNVGISSSFQIYVPTKVTVTNPADGSTIGGVINSFTATFQEPVEGYIYLYIDGKQRSYDVVSGQTSVAINYSWDTNQYLDGTTHVVEIKGRTSNGSVPSTGKSTVTIDNTVDVTSPVVSVTSPIEGSFVGPAGETVALTATATDKVGVNKVEFYIDNVKVGESVTSPYSYNWVSTVGKHTILAKAYDAAGNIGISSSFWILVPTKVTVTSPADVSVVGGVVSTFTATFQDPVEGTIYLYIDGKQVSYDVVSSRTSVSINYSWDTNLYADGTTHVVEIKGWTSNGSVPSAGKSTVTADNTVDVTAPVVSVTSPVEGSFVGPAGETVALTATATDKVGVNKVEFYIDNVKVGESVTSPYSYNWVSTVGNHTILAKAHDAAGNIGTSSSITIFVPTKVTVTSPVDGSVVRGVVSSFNATFQNPVEGYIYLYIDGNQVSYDVVSSSTSVGINYSWDTNQYTDGTTHVVEIKGRTSTGSVLSTGKSIVTVDNSPDTIAPVVSITSPANESSVSPAGDNVTLAASATDNLEVTKVEFYIDNVKVGESLSSPFNYSWVSVVGSHTLLAKAYDEAGNIGTSSSLTIYVPTKVIITSPSDASVVRGVLSSFTATFQEPVSGSVDLYIDGTYRAQQSVTTTTSATITYNWDGSQYENGTTHVIEIKGSTSTGGVTSTGKSTVTVDNSGDLIAPSVTITSPSNTTVSPSGEPLTITANATDNVGVTKIEFYLDNVKIGESFSVPASCSWVSTVGSHTITVKAYDKAGNIGVKTKEIFVPLKVTVTSPVNGSTVAGTVTSFKATFQAPLVSGYAELYIDGIYRTQLGVNGATNVTLNYTWNSTQYVDGTHLIEIKGYDYVNGPTSVGKSTVTVDNIVDITAPVVSITSPTNGSLVAPAGETVTITANATDSVGVTKVEFYVDNVKVGESTAVPYSYNWVSTVGSHTLYAKAYDADGNIGTSNSITISVPTTVNITSPANGSTVNGLVSSFNAAFRDPVSGNVDLFIDGTLKASKNVTNVTNVSIDYSWDTNQYANGTSHSIEIQAKTATGLIQSSGTSTVAIDNSIQTTLNLEGTLQNGWYVTDVKVSFTVTSGWGSVAKTVYSFDNVNWHDYTAPFVLTGEKNWNPINYKSISITGYEEETKYAAISIDTMKPTVNIKNPDGSGFKLGQSMLISANATDPSGISKVEFYVDGILLGEGQFQPSSWPRQPYYYIYWIPTTSDTHTITAKAYDNATGDYGTSSVTFKELIVTVTSPNKDNPVSGIVSSFKATTSAPVTEAYLYIDGVWANNLISDPTTNIEIPYQWDTTQYPNNSTHIIEISCETVNSLSASDSITITVNNNAELTGGSSDVMAPEVSITSPTNGSTVNATGNTVPITVSVNDNVGVTKVELYVDDVKVGESVTAPYSFNWVGTVGSHTFVAKAYDAAGNVGTSNGITLYVPTRVTVTGPEDGSVVAGTVSTFNVTFQDPVSGNVDLYIDGSLKFSKSVTSATSVSLSFAWDTNQYNALTTHVIEIKAKTVTGNIISIGKSTVTVGTTVRMSYPLNGVTVSGILTNFTATSTNAISRADLYIDGTKRASKEAINSTNINVPYNWDTYQYGDYTTHTIEIRAYTVASNAEVITKSIVTIENYVGGG